MILKQIHLDYWQSKKLPVWTDLVAKRKKSPNIDDVVNSHVEEKRISSEELSIRCAKLNVLALLSMQRRHSDDLEGYLNNLVRDPGCLIDPEKRSFIASRILRKLLKSRQL